MRRSRNGKKIETFYSILTLLLQTIYNRKNSWKPDWSQHKNYALYTNAIKNRIQLKRFAQNLLQRIQKKYLHKFFEYNTHTKYVQITIKIRRHDFATLHFLKKPYLRRSNFARITVRAQKGPRCTRLSTRKKPWIIRTAIYHRSLALIRGSYANSLDPGGGHACTMDRCRSLVLSFWPFFDVFLSTWMLRKKGGKLWVIRGKVTPFFCRWVDF